MNEETSSEKDKPLFTLKVFNLYVILIIIFVYCKFKLFILHLKKWNAVCYWSWDCSTDTCAICRVQVRSIKKTPAGFF